MCIKFTKRWLKKKKKKTKKLEKKVTSFSEDYLQLNDEKEAVEIELENKKHIIKNLQKEILTERENFYDFAEKAQAWREWQLEEKLADQKERIIHLYEKPLPTLPSKLKVWKKKLVNKIKKVIHYKEKKQEIQYVAQIEIRQ